jgi:hypothetical protein
MPLLQATFAQVINITGVVSKGYPRFPAGTGNQKNMQQLIEKEEWAKTIFNQSRQSIEQYVNRHQTDSAWIVSRLQMFWKAKSTDIFIKGGTYDHAEGMAPVPTVKFSGMRGGVSAHAAPKLEDLMPYMDDPRGLYLLNKSTNQMEWVDISKTANIIEGINNNIMQMAYTSSALYYICGEEKYAKFAFDLFDTYMTGMQYRKEPIDLSNGHHQTLAGLSSFEVIQEVAILNSLTGIYDFLHHYILQRAPQKNTLYSNVFRKWADLQIAHGVAFNNWNLIQAKNVLNIALILDDDKAYNDGKGSQYYTNYILNTSSQRQWSIQKVVNEGFDAKTGLWNESAGYSLNVLNDVVGFVSFFDKYYNIDLVEHLPVLKKAVTAAAQYLFPNGFFTSFGDSHYGRISLSAAYQMIANARKNKKPEQEKQFTSYIRAIQNFYQQRGVVAERGGRGGNISGILNADENIILDETIAAGNVNDYITPVFSSNHVSLFNLRNGFDANTGLMIAISGSKGNHMHAGGMSMEMYGKGYVLGPESGIGTNYFQADYAEYYSQFPAHNTVVVDGISAYPVMKSNHGFEVKSSYPASGEAKNYFISVSFGDLYFLEPETQSDQTRLISTIRTSDTTAYYIDIFRSKRKDGKDKMHDYFYHNLGQKLLLNDNKGDAFALQPTEQLSFGGGHLFAYDYIYDKKSIVTDKDVNAVFTLSVPGKEEVQMNLWMKGEKGREIISAKSPKSTAVDRIGLPKEIAELPLPTLVARQTGEAWTKPFVGVFEPSSSSQPKSIASIKTFLSTNAASDFVGLEIDGKAGDKQFVFSSDETGSTTIGNKQFTGTYAVIAEGNEGLQYLFMGNGKQIEMEGFSISAANSNCSSAIVLKSKGFYFLSSASVIVTIPARLFAKKSVFKIAIDGKVYAGKKMHIKGKDVVQLSLPASGYVKIDLK